MEICFFFLLNIFYSKYDEHKTMNPTRCECSGTCASNEQRRCASTAALYEVHLNCIFLYISIILEHSHFFIFNIFICILIIIINTNDPLHTVVRIICSGCHALQ